jgi:hypothetical protein
MTPLVFRALQGKATLGNIEINILEGAPAGRVRLRISDLKAPTHFRLLVRRTEDEMTGVADHVFVDARQAEVDLVLDLPEARWVPGAYEMRLEAFEDGGGATMWQSPWVSAFRLYNPIGKG